MPGGILDAPGNFAPAIADAKAAGQTERMLANMAQEMAELPPATMRRLLPVLQDARKELRAGLLEWLKHAPDGANRFTAQARRAALLNLETAIAKIRELQPAMVEALKIGGAAAGELSLGHLKGEVARMSTVFGETLFNAPQIRAADILTNSERVLIPKFRNSANRYAGNVLRDLQHQFGVGVSRGETYFQLQQRLRRLGGPKGLVALSKSIGDPGAIVEEISEGLFQRYRHWAQRVVRTECLPGDQLVSGAHVTAAHRRFFEGPMVEIVTASGRKISGTTNHPMLTRRGWVGAGLIREGDHLICYGGNQSPAPPGNEHVATGPASICEIFDALSTVGVRERRATAKPDFHGDGADGEVDIARPDGVLRYGSFATLDKPVIENVLAVSDRGGFSFCQSCGSLLSIDKQRCLCRVAQDDPGTHDSPLDGRIPYTEPSRYGEAGFSGKIPGDKIAGVDVAPCPGVISGPVEGVASLRARSRKPGGFDEIIHPPIATANPGGDSTGAKAGEVELDRVVSVRIREFRGHVYNLSTPYGYFAIDGVYTGNTSNAYNHHHEEGVRNLNDQLGDDEDEYLLRWDARNDGQCPICRALDRTAVKVGEQFAPGIYRAPAHPNCLCRVGAWRKDWGDIDGEAALRGPAPGPKAKGWPPTSSTTENNQ